MRRSRFLVGASTFLLAGGFLALTGAGTAGAQSAPTQFTG